MSERLPDDVFFERLAAGSPQGDEAAAPLDLRDRLFSALTADAGEEHLLENLPTEAPACAAPARLRSRIYSALVSAQAREGALLSLSRCKERGGELCVFEALVEILPVGSSAKSLNYCRICHARVLAEKMESAPIYWPGCPYSGFQNR